jgi:hypothetical protein
VHPAETFEGSNLRRGATSFPDSTQTGDEPRARSSVDVGAEKAVQRHLMARREAGG